MDPFGSGELRLLAPVAVLQVIELPTPAFSGPPSNPLSGLESLQLIDNKQSS
jgi:hypothetical protein